MVFGVGGVGKGVAHHIQADGDDGQYRRGEQKLIPQTGLAHEQTARLDQVAQRRDIGGQADADVGDKDLVADSRRDGQGHAQGNDPCAGQ